MKYDDLNAWRVYGDGGVRLPKPKKKKPGVQGSLSCRECGRSGVTLRKCSDGLYVCDECMKTGDEL